MKWKTNISGRELVLVMEQRMTLSKRGTIRGQGQEGWHIMECKESISWSGRRAFLKVKCHAVKSKHVMELKEYWS